MNAMGRREGEMFAILTVFGRNAEILNMILLGKFCWPKFEFNRTGVYKY